MSRFDGRRADNGGDKTVFLELMTLEARRDFLAFHAHKLNIRLTPTSSPSAATETKDQKKERLAREIAALESDLRTHLTTHSGDQDYLRGVLLPKVGTDADGISTRIANHFAQLSRTKTEKPFVILDESGLRLYWNKPEDAETFNRFLSAHGIPTNLQPGYLQDSDLPEALRSLRYDQCYQDQQNTRVVSIPHLYIEQFLGLAQYHSYSLKPVASDWYAAKKLNRGELVTAEGVAKRGAFSQEKFEVRFVDATRIHLNAKDDLVKVTITADVAPKPTQQPLHVVVLFDDSGSMTGEKIDVANTALKKFVMGLHPDTLVSIQPFCAATVANRKKASELQNEVRISEQSGRNPAWCSIQATGGTPLVEILASSAVFLRERPSDLAINDEAIRNTTVVLLTDGQANGAAKDAVFAMQTTSGFGAYLLRAVQVPGVTAENYLSYGLNGFSCRVLPAVFPISIGTDSDAVFMRELAETLHMPDAFVSTGANMQTEIHNAMSTLHHMLVRVPQVFAGLGYEHNGKRHAAGVEEHNVFNRRSRTIYFTLPRDARRLDLCTAIGSSTQVVSGSQGFEVAITDQAKTTAIMNEYAARCLMEIKMDYSKAALALSAGINGRHARDIQGGRVPLEIEPVAANPFITETDQKFVALKAQTLAAARGLLSITTNAETKRDIELFISTVEGHTSLQSPVQNVAPTRDAVAQYTQDRMIGQAVTALPAHTIAHTVFEDIRTGNFSNAIARLSPPNDVNQRSADQYSATPLISAIVKLNSDKKNADIRRFIKFLFDQATLDLTAQDASGNTALHRAAWYGLFDECRAMLQIAKERGQLDALKQKTNIATTGATAGETVADNIRRSGHLGEDQKKELLRLCGAAYIPGVDINTQLNSHIEPFWNTPIMQLLRDLRDGNTDDAVALRQYIVRLLDVPGVNLLESNFNGDTALHYAIWYGEFEIAEKIIEKTAPADRALLFAARNSAGLTHETGGEVPHMNLASSGKRALLHFQFNPTPEANAQLQRWSNLYNTVGQYVDKKQLAELTHLMQMYEKELQGYSTTTFLQAAPIVAFNKLLAKCNSMKDQHTSNTSKVDNLLKKLSEIKKDFSEKAVDEMIADLNRKIENEKQSPASAGFIESPIVQLYQHASETLTRLKDYVNAKSASPEPQLDDSFEESQLDSSSFKGSQLDSSSFEGFQLHDSLFEGPQLDASFRAALERLRQHQGHEFEAFRVNEDPKNPSRNIFVAQCNYIDRLIANTNQMPGTPDRITVGDYFKRLLIENLPQPVSLSTLQKELAARASQSAASPEHKIRIAILQNTGDSFNLATHLATPSRVLFAQGASQENFLEEPKAGCPTHPERYVCDQTQGPGIQEHNALMAMALYYAAKESGNAARSLSAWWNKPTLRTLLDNRAGYVLPALGKEAAFVEALRNSANLDAVRTFVTTVEPYGDPNRRIGIALNYGLPLTPNNDYDWNSASRNAAQRQAMHDAARLLIIQQYQTTTTAAAVYALQHPEKDVVVTWTSVGAGVFGCDLKWCIEGEIASIVALEQYNIPNLTVCHSFYRDFEPDYSKKLNELIRVWGSDPAKKQEVAVAIRLRDAVRLETSNVKSYETMSAAISASASSTPISYAAPAVPAYAAVRAAPIYTPAPAAPVYAPAPAASPEPTLTKLESLIFAYAKRFAEIAYADEDEIPTEYSQINRAYLEKYLGSGHSNIRTIEMLQDPEKLRKVEKGEFDSMMRWLSDYRNCPMNTTFNPLYAEALRIYNALKASPSAPARAIAAAPTAVSTPGISAAPAAAAATMQPATAYSAGLDGLITQIGDYLRQQSLDEDKRRSATTLLNNLNEFRNGRIPAYRLARYLATELAAPTLPNMFKATFGSSRLKNYFENALQLVDQVVYRLKVCNEKRERMPANDNFATSVERIDGGYKIHAVNDKDQERFIIVRDNGELVGHQGLPGKPTGLVEEHLFEKWKEVFAHFKIQLPLSHNHVAAAAPTVPTRFAGPAVAAPAQLSVSPVPVVSAAAAAATGNNTAAFFQSTVTRTMSEVDVITAIVVIKHKCIAEGCANELIGRLDALMSNVPSLIHSPFHLVKAIMANRSNQFPIRGFVDPFFDNMLERLANSINRGESISLVGMSRDCK